MSYAVFALIFALDALAFYVLGVYRERNRQAAIRARDYRLQRFSPSQVSKN